MNKKNTFLVIVFTAAITLGISISVQSLLAAWQSPTVAAPGGNVFKPLNVGDEAQSKSGILTTAGGLVIETRTAAQGYPASPANGRMWLMVN